MTSDNILAGYAAKKALAAKAAAAAAIRREEETKGKILTIDPERLKGVVEPSEFTCETVWTVFHALTHDWRTQDREATWNDIRTRLGLGPDKVQLHKISIYDWIRFYAEFTGRKDLLAAPKLGLEIK